MTAQQLQPLEVEIVAALKERGTLTTREVHAAVTAGGRHCQRSSVRTRLAFMVRLGLVERRVPGQAGYRDPIPTVWGLVD